MTDARPPGNLWEAYGKALLELGEKDPKVVVIAAETAETSGADTFQQRFPDRSHRVRAGDPTLLATAARESEQGHCVYATTSAAFVAGAAYTSVRDLFCRRRANVKLVADEGGGPSGRATEAPLFLEDIGIMRGLPGMTVLLPSDAPSTRGAVLALHASAGPAYVRLARGTLPTVTDGMFQIGRAQELRGGQDLTIVAVGRMVAPALDTAEELGKVGVSTRVLDFASIKPFDEPSLLRAARDTGAILVLEEHSVVTGVGALVASTTAENYPVPVRRVGVPDLFVEAGDPTERLEHYGLGPRRIRDEAWELLRLRGKVS